ncbi:hypothetical protein LTR36_006453 [Oleoguttula mirabilis]|uniref:DUF747-domain-containing protein n=1 Tax=Oleoguttula mirabilis TaxID=1507867 RepID=A0AAV9JWP7_9PEZI|nr:hypothetical protein LTR36_006453 [Oleoguttula mirabilis]
MSGDVEWSGDGDVHTAATANGQLLSPISEHGEDNGIQPFPGYEADDEGLKSKEHTADTVSADGTRDVHDASDGGSVGRRKRSTSGPTTPRLPNGDAQKMLKLSPRQIHDLVTSPDSLPIRSASPLPKGVPHLSNGLGIDGIPTEQAKNVFDPDGHATARTEGAHLLAMPAVPALPSISATPGAIVANARPGKAARSASSPLLHRKQSSSRSIKSKPDLAPIKTGDGEPPLPKPSPKHEPQASPMPPIMPVPPLSLPTYLQLELSSNRPSALYIHRSATSDFPYESSRVKFERLSNVLFLPFSLEPILWFGAIACLDAWLYTFTILPLRFLKAVAILVRWWAQSVMKEVYDLWSFVRNGLGRLWHRRTHGSDPGSRRGSVVALEKSQKPAVVDEATVDDTTLLNGHVGPSPDKKPRKSTAGYRHRRTRSTPSALLPNHKADILQGLLIFLSCYILMWFDASRMYHSIRGQSAIKLYVIYNVLEVFDRLLSAIGQDILECLFSKETLERNENGRSKVFRPVWMFLVALVYNVGHATALFYQVITLNVAVNSYSNALLTLLMSNQFVEIKGTVFKKFEKENLFQLTCADVVERFQLWLMLLIIALRNIVEVGGLSISISTVLTAASTPTDSFGANATGVPLTSGFVIPKAFTLFPKWTGEVLGPFLIVLGSEMAVDWVKHCYIAKFNNVKPNIYGRFLDVLAKDYYSHAFADQNLTKRLGLPVIPLSCLFIRACIQTYHMFLATHVPMPMPSAATAVSVDGKAAATSPATLAALQHIDHVFRRAIGRSSFGAGSDPGSSFSWWSIDDVIAFATMITFFLALYLVLLACKLVLGMLLLSYARSRYKGMKERERQVATAEGRRVGGWGVVEVGEDKRRWIYDDDPDGLRELREKEERGRKQSKGEKGDRLDGVDRYMMAAKRIW